MLGQRRRRWSDIEPSLTVWGLSHGVSLMYQVINWTPTVWGWTRYPSVTEAPHCNRLSSEHCLSEAKNFTSQSRRFVIVPGYQLNPNGLRLNTLPLGQGGSSLYQWAISLTMTVWGWTRYLSVTKTPHCTKISAEPRRSDAEHATSRSRSLPTVIGLQVNPDGLKLSTLPLGHGDSPMHQAIRWTMTVWG